MKLAIDLGNTNIKVGLFNKEELVQMLTYYKSGTTVTLTVQSLTDGAYVEHEVEITLGSRPADEANQ